MICFHSRMLIDCDACHAGQHTTESDQILLQQVCLVVCPRAGALQNCNGVCDCKNRSNSPCRVCLVVRLTQPVQDLKANRNKLISFRLFATLLSMHYATVTVMPLLQYCDRD